MENNILKLPLSDEFQYKIKIDKGSMHLSVNKQNIILLDIAQIFDPNLILQTVWQKRGE